jgi:hypothetical protein
MNRTRSLFQSILIVGAVLATPGCDGILGSLTRTYPGPEPSREDIAAETVIVRTVSTQPGTGFLFFYVDRERFLASDPHNINRVVEVTSRDLHPAVAALELKPGDRVRISTRFLSLREAGALGQHVPNWPLDRYDEYLLGLHALTSIERVAP